MKRRPLMQSRSSSKTVLRRSRPRGAFPCLLVFLLAALAASPAAAQSLDMGLSVRPTSIRADLWFRWNKEQELVSSLQQGMEARIVFTLRLYQRRRGVIPFLGDKLILETHVARSAFWDFLDRTFVVESDDGSRAAYPTAAELLQGFLTVRNFPVSTVLPSSGEERYVTARARLEPVRLMPPLTIVTLAGAAASYTTPWERRDAK